MRGLGTNLMAFARTSRCAPAPEGERYAVSTCWLAGWRSIPIRALPVSLSLTFCASKLFFPAAIIGREKEPSETRAHVERERERERQGQGGALHLFAINTLFWRRWVYELRQSGMSRRRAAFVHSRRRSQPPRPSRPQVKRFRQAAWRPL